MLKRLKDVEKWNSEYYHQAEKQLLQGFVTSLNVMKTVRNVWSKKTSTNVDNGDLYTIPEETSRAMFS